MDQQDIARSFEAYLTTNLSGNRLDLPGTRFSPERAQKEWIEVRYDTVDPRSGTLPGPRFLVYGITVRCFVKTQPRGGRALALDALVDVVRAVLDPDRDANGLDITDSDSNTTGRMTFGSVTEARDYSADALIGAQAVEGVDIATLTLSALCNDAA